MWFHLELKGKGYEAARSGVAVSDTPTGPYRFIRSVVSMPENFPLIWMNRHRQQWIR